MSMLPKCPAPRYDVSCTINAAGRHMEAFAFAPESTPRYIRIPGSGALFPLLELSVLSNGFAASSDNDNVSCRGEKRSQSVARLIDSRPGYAAYLRLKTL